MIHIATSNRKTVQERLRLIRAHEDAIWEEFQRRWQESGGTKGIDDAATQRILDEKLQDLSLGRNVVMYVGPGVPSIMVHIKGESLSFLEPGWSDHLHPAFTVHGAPIPQLYVGKYQAYTITDDGGTTYAVSLRGRDPRGDVTFDEARQFCANNNALGTKGWHLMTNAEWAFLALWCRQNGFWPRGNNYYGKDYQRADEYGELTAFSNEDGRGSRVACGSGPRYTPFWSHDGTPMGVWDLNGNVREWVGGLRLVDGEIQVIPDNDAADTTVDQSASSDAWRAIQQDGSLVDPGTPGTLKYDSPEPMTDDGISQIRSTPILRAQVLNGPDPGWGWGDEYHDYNRGAFGNLGVDQDVTVPAIAQQLALVPLDSDHGGDYIYTRNYGERLARRGGRYTDSFSAGVFFLYLLTSRSDRSSVGFRPAYVPGLS